jgi:hypothetical protein
MFREMSLKRGEYRWPAADFEFVCQAVLISFGVAGISLNVHHRA